MKHEDIMKAVKVDKCVGIKFNLKNFLDFCFNDDGFYIEGEDDGEYHIDSADKITVTKDGKALDTSKVVISAVRKG